VLIDFDETLRPLGVFVRGFDNNQFMQLVAPTIVED
jgi:hypothetical protein